MRESQDWHGSRAAVSDRVHFNVIRSTKQLIKQLNIPTSIAEAGVSREDFMAALDEMVNAAMNDACTATNPRDCTPEEVRDLFLGCL